MRVLHLYSNKRWTGPAEPAANLAAGLMAEGVDVTFAIAADGAIEPHQMGIESRARGLSVRTDLHLHKHFHPLSIATDAGHLARDLRAGAYDLLHCHQPVDHCTAALARQNAHAGIPIVRSLYEGATVNGSWTNGLALRHCTEALCVTSPDLREHVVQQQGIAAERVHLVDGAVDTQRFHPGGGHADARTGWGFERDHIVFGVVARMQPYRRFDVLWPALKQAIAVAPNVRLVLVGRGTRAEEVAHRPVRQLGLTEHVHYAGYLEGDNYVAALAALDALIYLMPGSDGTCRTVREALAMGTPVITARRGILPWLVQHDETGVVLDDSIEKLADALTRYATDEAARAALQAGARREGPTRFSLQRQVGTVLDVYRDLLHA